MGFVGFAMLERVTTSPVYFEEQLHPR